MKKRELVLIHFVHAQTEYSALVYKNSQTAIVLPDKTVLQTNCFVHTTGPRRQPSRKSYVRNIFDNTGNLMPLSVIRRPGNWDKPLDTHLPIVFADPE